MGSIWSYVLHLHLATPPPTIAIIRINDVQRTPILSRTPVGCGTKKNVELAQNTDNFLMFFFFVGRCCWTISVHFSVSSVFTEIFLGVNRWISGRQLYARFSSLHFSVGRAERKKKIRRTKTANENLFAAISWFLWWWWRRWCDIVWLDGLFGAFTMCDIV